jgi:protein TonB
MDYLGQQRRPLQNASRLAAVALLHIGLIYAFVNGLSTATTGRGRPPATATIVDIPPPPPPVPPAVPVPELPSPTLFVPRIDLPHAPPPLPRAPVAFGAAPAPPGAVATHAQTPQADTAFSPSAILGGAPAPGYPGVYEDAARSGRVTVDCTIETNGDPAGCRIVNSLGGPAFATETLRWLTGPTHPLYKPALRGGVAQREEHQWVVLFEPPSAGDNETR